MTERERFLATMNHQIPDRIPLTVIDIRLEGQEALKSYYGVGSYNGKYVEWVSGPLVDAKEPDEIFIPTIDDIVDDPDLPRKVQELKYNN